MAVRKLAYTESRPLEQTSNDVLPSKKPRKKAATIRLIDALPVILCLIIIGGVSSLIISRYAYINRLQIDIFNLKQDVKAYEQDIYKLNIKCESFMTINEIQTHANDELGMILPTEKNKVVIKTSDYYILDKTVAFKGSDTQNFAEMDQGNAEALK